jgi:hypothetical protein
VELHRLYSFQNALYEEETKLYDAREEVLAERLTTELQDREDEYEVLKGEAKTAKDAKDEYDTEETRLRDARTAMDTDGSDQATKDAADQELADHQNTKQGIYEAEEDAKNAMDQKRQAITDAATQREDLAY